MVRFRFYMKQILAFVLPISGNQLINIMSTIIPMYFLSQVNKYEMAAAALASTAFVTCLTLGRGLFNATSILISHRVGEGTEAAREEVGFVYRNSLLLGGVVGSIALVLMWNMSAILLMFGQDAHLVFLCRYYFHYAGLCLLLMMIGIGSTQFYTAIGRPQVNFWISVFRAPVTIVLSYVFIFGCFGVPALGLGGIMMGSFLTQIPVSLLTMTMIYFSSNQKKYQMYRVSNVFHFPLLKEQVRIGLPIALQSSAEMIGITVIVYMMGWFGVDALAASQIVNQYVIVLVVFYLGCSQAMSILVSRAVAEKKPALIKDYTHVSIVLLTVFMFFVAVIFLFFHTPLTELFLNNENAQHHDHIQLLAKYFFMIAIVMNYCDGVRYILSGVYRGLRNTAMPMWVGLISICGIGIASSYVMGVWFDWQAVGVRLGLALGIVCSSLYLLCAFYSSNGREY